MEWETIYALSSAPGKAGVALVRVSGPAALSSLASIARLTADPVPRRALFTSLHDPRSGKLIDKALVISFKEPASFTGENVVEYQLHGSPAVIDALMSALAAFPNHRMAAPGEFTRRAFENGKLDLTEAEAVADLIDAETEQQRLQALSQMDGALSRLYEDWRARLVKAMAYVEAVIDFADEEIPDSETASVIPTLRSLLAEIEAHLDDNRRGERLRNGIFVAILGAPNAGKSSLLNLLGGRDIAIVSPLAGTTRDVIEAHADIGGFPVIFADTAGLRAEDLADDGGHGTIEGEGIRRALARADDADIRLLVFDGTQAAPDEKTMALLNDRSIVVLTRADSENFNFGLESFFKHVKDTVVISTINGSNLDRLTDTLTDSLRVLYSAPRGSSTITRARHRTAVQDCREHINNAIRLAQPELMAEDLRLAARALGRIVGRVDIDDILDVIFRDFCIGK